MQPPDCPLLLCRPGAGQPDWRQEHHRHTGRAGGLLLQTSCCTSWLPGPPPTYLPTFCHCGCGLSRPVVAKASSLCCAQGRASLQPLRAHP